MTLSAIAALDCQPERPQEEPRVLVMADHLCQNAGHRDKQKRTNVSGQTKKNTRSAHEKHARTREKRALERSLKIRFPLQACNRNKKTRARSKRTIRMKNGRTNLTKRFLPAGSKSFGKEKSPAVSDRDDVLGLRYNRAKHQNDHIDFRIKLIYFLIRIAVAQIITGGKAQSLMVFVL